jgi:hypothetical protein
MEVRWDRDDKHDEVAEERGKTDMGKRRLGSGSVVVQLEDGCR